MAALTKIAKGALETIPKPSKVNISSYDWINDVLEGSPKLRGMVGKDIQRSFNSTMEPDELPKFYFEDTPEAYGKVLKDYKNSTYIPTDFDMMDLHQLSPGNFQDDLNLFLMGEKPTKGGMFEEFVKTHKKQQKANFGDAFSPKELEANQREFFYKQLFSEGIQNEKTKLGEEVFNHYRIGGKMESDPVTSDFFMMKKPRRGRPRKKGF
tara:strand:+ start:344 stop:970 length:627 start_codon:yes stop_codon:yes gene_type:complete